MHNQKIDLAFDLAFSKNAAILTTIDLAIEFCYCVPLKNMTKGELFEGTNIVLRMYNYRIVRLGQYQLCAVD